MATPAPQPALVGRLFDRLDRGFHSPSHRRVLSAGLVVAFLAALLVIELGRRGLLGERLGAALPHSHFYAVELAFYLLLAFEVVSLVFAIAQSVANAAGKQFEIFSLILLRRAFEPFAGLDEPVRWDQAQAAVWPMAADAVAALLLFVLLGFYYALQRHQPLSADLHDRDSFVETKKAISLVLLGVFSALAARSLWALATHLTTGGFFEAFYTVLIFADVLVVLISLRYNASYRVVFRNSGLAVATLLLRLSLSAPAPWAGALGITAGLFAVGLTLAYNRFAPVLGDSSERRS